MAFTRNMAMEERKYFWVFDHDLFREINLPELTWFEGFLILCALLGLVFYLALARILERRQKRLHQEEKQLAWLARWLEHAKLTPVQLDRISGLAGGDAQLDQARFLDDPVTFETRIHQAVSGGRSAGIEFTHTVREKLRYQTDNLRVPVVSTRQLKVGDPVRIAMWVGGLPVSYYGKVRETDLHELILALRPEAVKAVLTSNATADLYYMRGQGLEYRFDCRPIAQGKRAGQLRCRHHLIQGLHRPRHARLPLVQEIRFQARAYTAEAASDLDPETAAPFQTGLILDLSEGGFSIVHASPVPEGNFIEFSLPLKRSRAKPHLIGKVLESREFSGNQYLSRCELRGVSPTVKNLLHQVVRMEQMTRLRVLAPIARRSGRKRA